MCCKVVYDDILNTYLTENIMGMCHLKIIATAIMHPPFVTVLAITKVTAPLKSYITNYML